MWNRIFKEISDRLTVPPIPTMDIDTSRTWQDTYRCFEDLRLGTENAKSPCPCVEPVTSKFVANVTRHEEFRFNSLLHRLSMSRTELRYKKAHPGTLYLWISLDFRNSIPILRTRTGRWHARLFIFSVRLHVHAICFWLRSLASSAPGILLLRWGLYGYRGLFACCSMRFLKILKKMHSAVVINERLMFHLFSKCQLPCLRILFLQFSGLHWTGQWFVT